MQIHINRAAANAAIADAPAKSAHPLPGGIVLEFFDYGSAMGWGEDHRARFRLPGGELAAHDIARTPTIALPTEKRAVYGRARPNWLPAGVTLRAFNAAFAAAARAAGY
jgi:hypothetical protein